MMATLPAALDRAPALVAWRIDMQRFAASWHSGIGAERFGGRWNPKGFKAVYCSLDPSTALVEAAVHRGFSVLDTTPHVLTGLEIIDTAGVRVVLPAEIPDAAWLHGGMPSANQQAFGAALLAAHDFVVVPSAVSRQSWNLVFEPDRAQGKYRQRWQESLAVDTRLSPPSPSPARGRGSDS
jgi:RES domain-containing protein